MRGRRGPPTLGDAGQVQSTVTAWDDSLQVIVAWELATPPPAGADSLRVEVQIDSQHTVATRVRLHSGRRRVDTVYVPAPPPGASAEGLSCVAIRPLSSAIREICTPWRYVRPQAAPRPQSRVVPRGVKGDTPIRIVVRPSGLQVDPDIGGRCAAWQRQHPGASVWIDVNRRAVPACTGPNGRPTVAQFCAFAELADGRRIETSNSRGIAYCDALFRAWERERIS
jgi:hypothetical protein